MIYVCNLRNIHSLSNVVILFTIKTCQPCHYIKPKTHVYTRERHENKNMPFWATYGFIDIFISVTCVVDFNANVVISLSAEWFNSTLQDVDRFA